MDTFTFILELLICIFSILNGVKRWNSDRKNAFLWFTVAIAAVIFMIV